jgi:hypothetical protein
VLPLCAQEFRAGISGIVKDSQGAIMPGVPIEALLTPQQPEVRYVQFGTRRYPAYFYRYERHEVWGLTGRILKHFLDFVWRAV